MPWILSLVSKENSTEVNQKATSIATLHRHQFHLSKSHYIRVCFNPQSLLLIEFRLMSETCTYFISLCRSLLLGILLYRNCHVVLDLSFALNMFNSWIGNFGKRIGVGWRNSLFMKSEISSEIVDGYILDVCWEKTWGKLKTYVLNYGVSYSNKGSI